VSPHQHNHEPSANQRLGELRFQVREFLAQEMASGGFVSHPAGWDRHDGAFSRKLGQRGWIGMAWPTEYGGGGRNNLERYVVVEELLSAGAPVWAHWLADRQVGPLILKHGTETQKRSFLPAIAAGECFFCVGLSEPDSGSDLASIRTRADRVHGGWRATGTKIWTSYAHQSHYMSLFARTSRSEEGERHTGFSQFLVNLSSPGITIRPIINLDNHHDLNEVVFDSVFIPDEMIVGKPGDGWTQVTGELVHERSGPERWLSSYGLLKQLVDCTDTENGSSARLGSLVSQLWTLRQMSWSVAEMLSRGLSPEKEAALVKDVGTTFDKRVPEVARELVNECSRASEADDSLARAIEHGVLYAPSYSLRGGAPEILRSIIARGLGLR
jgi:acyl-CoA dehydrogenase